MFLTRAQLFFLVLAGSGVSGALAQSQAPVKLRASVGIIDNDNFFSAPTAAVSERVTSQTLRCQRCRPLQSATLRTGR